MLTEMVSQHFPLPDAGQREYMQIARAIILELSAAVYHRVDAYLSRWPYRLLRMVHPGLDEGGRRAAAEVH